jgi:hypothetical protein
MNGGNKWREEINGERKKWRRESQIKMETETHR